MSYRPSASACQTSIIAFSTSHVSFLKLFGLGTAIAILLTQKPLIAMFRGEDYRAAGLKVLSTWHATATKKLRIMRLIFSVSGLGLRSSRQTRRLVGSR